MVGRLREIEYIVIVLNVHQRAEIQVVAEDGKQKDLIPGVTLKQNHYCTNRLSHDKQFKTNYNKNTGRSSLRRCFYATTHSHNSIKANGYNFMV